MNEFDELLKYLNQLMLEVYIAVDPQRNPIVRSLNQASFSQLVYVIRQYSIFPKELVSFVKSSEDKAIEAGWLEVASKVQENIAEELGSLTQGISHYDLLAEGLEEGLNLPIKDTIPSIATLHLLESMQALSDREAAYTFGAVYAIEATSISELMIVMQIIEQVIAGSMPYNLRYFFDMHLNEWEPEHEENLQKTLAHCIKDTSFHQFEAGFCAVMEAMDLWWTELALEAISPTSSLDLGVA
ncbi:MAG: DUF3865 domain-containing protein [Trichocoleus desertorum ATA4-8-CV12]|jgi:hypothetical protein|nr:DUF3865 domain-containing protein [Trichocoleus desertorum ATA4-8-CV12]